MKKLKVKKIEVQSVSDELTDAIVQVSAAMKVLSDSRLSERALIMLLKDATG